MEVANKVGAAHIVGRVVDDLKDENEQYRKMVLETIEKVMANLGASEIDSRLEEQLIDGILYAFQEQTNEVSSCPVYSRLASLVGILYKEVIKSNPTNIKSVCAVVHSFYILIVFARDFL